MPTPTPEEMRVLAEARLRRHGWARFEAGTRRTALRMARTQFDVPQIGDLVEIVTASHAEPGITGRLTAIDPTDPIDRYRVQGTTGPVAWATTIRPA